MEKKTAINGSLIEFGNLEESAFAELLRTKYSEVQKIILVDENTHDFCLEYLITTFPELESSEVMLLPVGEENKVMEVCFQVWEALSEYGINRNDLIINLGGGVVTDMGGFIASVFKRGIDFIQIPTSLLAMVDAAIGGKTGIDLGPYKNQLGTFTMPVATFIDVRFLHSLPEIERINGLAEVIKHGLIADAELWNDLKAIQPEYLVNPEYLEAITERSAWIKIQVVNADPKEKNVRKLLNFGHTIGHAIEGTFLIEEQTIPHGIAVAYGMIAESFISWRRGMLSADELEEITALLVQIYPKPPVFSAYTDIILQNALNDKKNDAAGIRCVLLRTIGEGVYNELISNEEIREALFYTEAVFAE